MGRKSLRFVFGIFLAVGTVLAITTWAASPTPQSGSVATAKATIYRPIFGRCTKGSVAIGRHLKTDRRERDKHQRLSVSVQCVPV